MFIFLAISALFLSAIGLYTLVSLSIINRTKEIGIRKVMGATILKIMIIISKPFAILIIISSAFGAIGGYYLTEMLMGSVWKEYMSPNALSFIIPITIILMTSIVTIIWRVYKSAMQNPVNSLRYE